MPLDPANCKWAHNQPEREGLVPEDQFDPRRTPMPTEKTESREPLRIGFDAHGPYLVSQHPAAPRTETVIYYPADSPNVLSEETMESLIEALRPVADAADELEAKGYFDDVYDEELTYPDDIELTVAELKRARQALRRLTRWVEEGAK